MVRFDSVQPRYNLLFRQIERELLPLCAEEGIGVIPYNPIAGGLLTRQARRAVAAPGPGTRFTLGSAGGAVPGPLLARAAVRHRRASFRPLAPEAGMPLATLAVAWVLANPAITSPIIGASRAEQLDDLHRRRRKSPHADLKARLDELTADYRKGDAGR